MKRTGLILTALTLAAGVAGATELQLGFSLGHRTVDDAGIDEVYGGGTVYSPTLAVGVWRGFVLGVGYEGGYSKQAQLGLFAEPARLEVDGFEVFAGYEHRLGRLRPYLRLGLGSFAYEQTIESDFVGDIVIDGRETTLTLSGGAKCLVHKGAFVSGEVKYVPLSVQPFEEEVELGGWRFSVGVGYAFGF